MNSLTNIATNGVAGFMEDLSLVPIPPWWQSPWFILLALVSLALLALVGRRFYRKFAGQSPDQSAVASVPGEPADVIALRQLEELRAKIDELGAYRLTIECSLVLRRFIAARFGLSIIYQTTREFLGHAQTHSSLHEEARRRLGEYLPFCDLVKFARREASRAEMVQLVDNAILFVKASAAAAQAGTESRQPEPAGNS